MSDKNGGLFPKIDKKNLLTVPELVTPPGTVDEEEEASISVSQPNAIEGIQGCINCGILLSRIRARGVSSEHMENMEMFSSSPT